MPGPAAPPRRRPPQLSFDELGTPLREVTFVVLDLETTGGSPDRCSITEVGAVKVRGGAPAGELATLVDPGVPIPAAVAARTGITWRTVAGAPSLDGVLPMVLEFLAGSVLVAHNAPFDVGFLRAACERRGTVWPRPPVLCTARLGRAVLSRAEAPSVRLGALADLFGTSTRPTHRALADAHATVEVLHHLLERVGNLGVQSLEELLELARGTAEHRPSSRVRRRRHLADGVPAAPGVYLFRGARDEVLYVGTSADLHRRVRSYFTAGERRRRVRDMVEQAERVEAVVCAHAGEAAVRELRLIAAHRPRYNRRSREPGRGWWVVTTEEAFPRLSVVREPRAGALGPFRSRGDAGTAVEVLLDALAIGGRTPVPVPLRACTPRIAVRDGRAARPTSPCALHELGRCGAPCAGAQDVGGYAPAVSALRALVHGHDDRPLNALAARIDALAAEHRFAEAARHRDRLADLLVTLSGTQRRAALAGLSELVGARPDGSGGWELEVVRYGRLVAADVARRGTAPMPVVQALRREATTVLPADGPGPGPLTGANPEEVAVLHRWFTTGGTRLVVTDPAWTEPAHGAGRWDGWVRKARAVDPDL